MRAVTTLVAVVGERATQAATHAARAGGNVSMEPVGDVPPQPTEAIERMREVWRRAQRHGSIYTVVDADPLGPVVGQWAARLEGQAHDLEVAIGLSADLPMPDFYLVATDLPQPQVHWYLGLLEDLSPARVVPLEMQPQAVLSELGVLRFGPAFPSSSRLAARARDFVPIPGLRPTTGQGEAGEL